MILLTGASGFIGSFLLKSLKEKYGYKNVVALTSKPLEGYQYLIHNNYTFSHNFFIENGFENIEVIVHAGAFIPKGTDESNDVIKCNQNIASSFTILSSKLPKLKKIIFLSTIDVYNDSKEPLNEDSFINPSTLYAASKLFCESMINTWAAQNHIDSIVLRIGHVFGPGEHNYKKIIPEVMRNIIFGKDVSMWGLGNDIRSYIYIDDVINAIVASLEEKKIDSPINIVSDFPLAIQKVIKTIINTSGKNIAIKQIPSDHEPRNLLFDNSKMRSQLYQPKISFEEGIKKEWEAFKLVYEKDNI